MVSNVATQYVPARPEISLPPSAQSLDAEHPAFGQLGFQQYGVVHVFLLRHPNANAVRERSQVESVLPDFRSGVILSAMH